MYSPYSTITTPLILLVTSGNRHSLLPSVTTQNIRLVTRQGTETKALPTLPPVTTQNWIYETEEHTAITGHVQ
jgi:hypothetical protein